MQLSLTRMQYQVFRLLINTGESNKRIAHRLGIKESTVKVHLQAIFKKSGIRSRVALVAAYLDGKISIPAYTD